MEQGGDLGVRGIESFSRKQKTSFVCPCGIIKYPKLYVGDLVHFKQPSCSGFDSSRHGDCYSWKGKHFTVLNPDYVHKMKLY